MQKFTSRWDEKKKRIERDTFINVIFFVKRRGTLFFFSFNLPQKRGTVYKSMKNWWAKKNYSERENR